jgi:hypothetical protein
MQWSVKVILGVTTIAVLVLVARQMDNEIIPWGQQIFILAFYLALVIGAGVLAVIAPWNRKGSVFAYSLFCTLYGILFLRREHDAEVVTRLSLIGILLRLACAIGVGLGELGGGMKGAEANPDAGCRLYWAP